MRKLFIVFVFMFSSVQLFGASEAPRTFLQELELKHDTILTLIQQTVAIEQAKGIVGGLSPEVHLQVTRPYRSQLNLVRKEIDAEKDRIVREMRGCGR